MDDPKWGAGAECDIKDVGTSRPIRFRSALGTHQTEEGIEVHRISGKATYDYQEIFDGVPSQHDGKDAAVIAELTVYGKGTAWPWQADSERLASVKHQVFRAEAYRGQQTQWSGRLEGLLARHWPELTSLLLNRIEGEFA